MPFEKKTLNKDFHFLIMNNLMVLRKLDPKVLQRKIHQVISEYKLYPKNKLNQYPSIGPHIGKTC